VRKIEMVSSFGLKDVAKVLDASSWQSICCVFQLFW